MKCPYPFFLLLLSMMGAVSQDFKPSHFMFAGSDINTVKERQSDAQFRPALVKLRADAEQALQHGPYSVMNKSVLPPSGDKHDYMSIGKYWWPDPADPGGPYIRRDGETNPAAETEDKAARRAMYRSATTLALAYFFFEKPDFAEHAAYLLRVWFLDDSTRMNPHLKYGQAVPGRSDGRPYGIIETRPFVWILDAERLISDSPYWTSEDHAKLVDWFDQYLNWLLTSDLGKQEGSNGNNHETSYDLQVASYALFVGKPQIAISIFETKFRRRLLMMIEPDGKQPREIARTKGLHYSSMNLALMLYICELALRSGIDLYRIHTDDGRSVLQAFHFLLPFLKDPDRWPFQQIEKSKPDYDEVCFILRTAARRFGCDHCESILMARYENEYDAHIGQLLWPRIQE